MATETANRRHGGPAVNRRRTSPLAGRRLCSAVVITTLLALVGSGLALLPAAASTAAAAPLPGNTGALDISKVLQLAPPLGALAIPTSTDDTLDGQLTIQICRVDADQQLSWRGHNPLGQAVGTAPWRAAGRARVPRPLEHPGQRRRSAVPARVPRSRGLSSGLSNGRRRLGGGPGRLGGVGCGSSAGWRMWHPRRHPAAPPRQPGCAWWPRPPRRRQAPPGRPRWVRRCLRRCRQQPVSSARWAPPPMSRTRWRDPRTASACGGTATAPASRSRGPSRRCPQSATRHPRQADTGMGESF